MSFRNIYKRNNGEKLNDKFSKIQRGDFLIESLQIEGETEKRIEFQLLKIKKNV